ncbi:MAG TPA: ABC transporter ATP-binding protein [Symbiobacteriaceae bacterium]|nr:ABC transporter ATP-binding protein [Symbiobacteriaceae bacterium]
MMIQAEGLSKGYGSTQALKSASMKIERGEWVAITGPSGSGKSTMLQLVGALDQPTGGKLIVDGIHLERLRGDALADYRFKTVGFIFQQYYLLPTMTALGNVMAPLLPRKVDFNKRRKAMQLLESVGLGHKMASLPSQLSGGEQQRVCIARALVADPPVLLADEPTGALDPRSGTMVLDLIEQLRRERGLTVLMVTHDPGVAERADRQVRMVDGLLTEAATV